MRFFDIAKVGCFCEGVSHSLEKRRGEDVKVLTLTLKVAPFSATHATAMPDGVKATLFKLNSGDPKDTLRKVDFALGVERQILHCFAAPDTEDATRALDQVRIHGTYARAPKDRAGFEFVFKATFGPVGRDELEFVQSWLLTQKFITFEAAEPGMFDDVEDDDDGTEADQKAQQPVDGRVPMWDDEPAAAAPSKAKPATERAHRPLHSHQTKRRTAGKGAAAKGKK